MQAKRLVSHKLRKAKPDAKNEFLFVEIKPGREPDQS